MILLQPLRQFIELSKYTYSLVKKCCGGDRLANILLYFPSGVSYRTNDLNGFTAGKLTVVVKIIDHKIPRARGLPYKIIGQTDGGDIVTIVYFNYRVPYLRNTFPIDTKLMVSGNATQHGFDGIQIVHPDVVGRPDLAKFYSGIEPVYPLTGNLTNRTLQYVINSVLKLISKDLDWLPAEIKRKYDLPDFVEALHEIHHPKSAQDIETSNRFRQRIAIDELLANQIRLLQIKRNLQKRSAPVLKENGDIFSRLRLPFELTADQVKCLEDIKADLNSGRPMNRLIQGDVGSGKTIVAFLGMLVALENKMQAALLAPTEILAWQHFETIQKLSNDLNLEIDVMLSSNRKARKIQISDLQTGKTQILVGTHAILEDNIEFRNLGFIVIDEQHKFGVMQRLKLIEKSACPNILSMSATPIPRTLLLGYYGDIDVSTIKTKPAGRQPIETVVISEKRIDELIARLKEMDSQIFWICPVIEENDSLTDVNTRGDFLKQAFSPEQVEVLHGKMKAYEKDKIMERFKENQFKLLVATTVIEVGIDIPNANVIVIEHAERFGLAQLHQLRGRVGRGDQKSYCILFYHFPISTVGKQRLQLMKSTNDGFEISEQDLKLRGAGDILGREQSGFNVLRFSDFADNLFLIKTAEEIAESLDLENQSIDDLCKIFNRVSEKGVV